MTLQPTEPHWLGHFLLIQASSLTFLVILPLVVINSLRIFLSRKLLISTSILNDRLAGSSSLGCRSLLFIILSTSCQSLLACKVSFEKSADSLMGTPL